MLKEVGASGQISLGKRFAKRLYEVVFHEDGRVELLPVRVVSAGTAASLGAGVLQSEPDGWVPPGGYDRASQWAVNNRGALEAYAERIAAEGTAAEQLQQYLAPSHGE